MNMMTAPDSAQGPGSPSRDHPEGHYIGDCVTCGHEFSGPKRERRCRICLQALNDTTLPYAVAYFGIHSAEPGFTDYPRASVVMRHLEPAYMRVIRNTTRAEFAIVTKQKYEKLRASDDHNQYLDVQQLIPLSEMPEETREFYTAMMATPSPMQLHEMRDPPRAGVQVIFRLRDDLDRNGSALVPGAQFIGSIRDDGHAWPAVQPVAIKPGLIEGWCPLPL